MGNKLIDKIQFLEKQDNKSVLLLFYLPAGNPKIRVNHIINNVLKLTEKKTGSQLKRVFRRFNQRHKNMEAVFLDYFQRIQKFIDKETAKNISHDKKVLIGACFSKEYSYKSTAFCNPSLTLHPDQNNISPGETRIIVSFRAIGEEHISCCAFSEGIIDKNNNIALIEDSQYKVIPEVNSMNKRDYQISFSKEAKVCERVIYPVADNEQHGIEDLRWTRFSNGKERALYYGTYTAYDGIHITPKMFSTSDFRSFKSNPLIGRTAKNKNMALFPRKIKGRYAMIARTDGIHMDIMYSDNPFEWDNPVQKINDRFQPWEFVQGGSNGVPMETKYGWLVITHGVGPVREYALGIKLLDLDNPSKVIARLKKPLLVPTEKERNGYVPNVLYSCGGLIHNNNLILPYAYSDLGTKYAVIDLKQLIAALR
ncbi:glycosidase [Candidatus Margulisiibacteriota bacterium]